MLKNRILSTLRFFDLQDYPLTLLELHKFLLTDIQILKTRINTGWELISEPSANNQKANIDEILKYLEAECQNETEQKNGFYCLNGRAAIIGQRLANYIYGIKRERRIRRFAAGLRYLPFVRGAALGGSQAMGLNKETSDIDLLVITEANFMWLARTWVTVYFQILGIRRYGRHIANRFCLNHYLARPAAVNCERNLYKAMEYGRLRPLIYSGCIEEFQRNNAGWINAFFPNWEKIKLAAEQPPYFQKLFERMFNNSFGRFLEKHLQSWQMARIKQGGFIFVTNEEMSFHPGSKHESLLQGFFELQ